MIHHQDILIRLSLINARKRQQYSVCLLQLRQVLKNINVTEKQAYLFCAPLYIANGCGLDDRGGRTSSSGRFKNVHFSISLRPVLGPIQLHAPAVLPPGKEHPVPDE
jgi:hypothetical protein